MDRFLDLLPLLAVLLIAVGYALAVPLRRCLARRAARTGEDLNLLRAAVDAGDRYLVYAHWEARESYGRAVRITYSRYAVAFVGQTLFVFPLAVSRRPRRMEAGPSTMFTADDLGKVTYQTRKKDGAVTRVTCCLADKQGKTLLQLSVDAENLRKNRWYPVNLLQPECCEAFARFLAGLSRQVAAENPCIDAWLEAERRASQGLGGTIVSVVGAFFSVFFPPLGTSISLLGLVLAVVGCIRGGSGQKRLLISAACLLWSAALLWMYWKYFL